jgi:hypothetical protein
LRRHPHEQTCSADEARLIRSGSLTVVACERIVCDYRLTMRSMSTVSYNTDDREDRIALAKRVLLNCQNMQAVKEYQTNLGAYGNGYILDVKCS